MDEPAETYRPTRVSEWAFLATAAAALLLLVAGRVVPFLPVFIAFVVALVGIGLAVAALNAGHHSLIAAVGLVANALVLVVALSIIAGIG